MIVGLVHIPTYPICLRCMVNGPLREHPVTKEMICTRCWDTEVAQVLKDLRVTIEAQKKHHAFRTHAYPELNKILVRIGK